MRPYLYIILIFCSSSILAQDLSELDRRNGFKDIKLTSDINQYSDLILNEKLLDEDVPEARGYAPKPGSYTHIGEIPIEELQVFAYKSKVYMIKVHTPKDENLVKGLKKAFGEPRQVLGSTSYFWETEKIKLVYGSFNRNKLELYYNSYVMRSEIKLDNVDRKIQEIADDF